MLGGVEIPYHRGLEGHSDADCLTHAIADAILGALALPDIGHFFPSGDPCYKDMDSKEILRHAVQQANSLGYHVGNVDTTVIAEEPKLAPHVPALRVCLAETLQVSESEVGVKATTNEGLGELGAGAGIAVHAICVLVRKD